MKRKCHKPIEMWDETQPSLANLEYWLTSRDGLQIFLRKDDSTDEARYSGEGRVFTLEPAIWIYEI